MALHAVDLYQSFLNLPKDARHRINIDLPRQFHVERAVLDMQHRLYARHGGCLRRFRFHALLVSFDRSDYLFFLVFLVDLGDGSFYWIFVSDIRIRQTGKFVENKRKEALSRTSFLAGDEGFEPPKTESESGVLPLH